MFLGYQSGAGGLCFAEVADPVALAGAGHLQAGLETCGLTRGTLGHRGGGNQPGDKNGSSSKPRQAGCTT